jgi:hypothetical protein
MLKILLVFLTALITSGTSAQNGVIDPKVKEALTQEQIVALTPGELEYLSVVANKLCYFQAVKEDETTELFDLKLKNGQSVILDQEQIENFNPLLYNLPQENESCVNCVVKDSSGAKHLLVIRSKKMIESDIKRMKSHKSNTQNK